MKQHIVIVGAGLAGLAAAYELRNDPDVQVTVLEERDRVGGRVQSVPVNGIAVDFGGFMIFPWYKEYRRLLKEVGLMKELLPSPLKTMCYRLDDSDKWWTSFLPYSIRAGARLVASMAKPVFQSQDPAAPALDAFDHKTAAQYIRDCLGSSAATDMYESYLDTLFQGYCYPPVRDYKMALLAGFIRPYRGSAAYCSYLKTGNDLFPEALARAIRHAGHTIELGVTVNGYRNHTLQTSKGEIKADKIIFAQNVDPQIHGPLLGAWAKKASYTQFAVLAVRTDDTPKIEEKTDWGGAFIRPTTESVQATSIVNLENLYGPRLCGYLNLNIVLRNDDKADPTKIFKAVEPSLVKLFPGHAFGPTDAFVHWKQTMPLVDESLIEQARLKQGKNDCYFAGDWLGAPSMETAVRTGIRAAKMVRGTEEATLPSFLRASKKAYQTFRQKNV